MLCQVALHIAYPQGNFVAVCDISETQIDVFIVVSRRLISHVLHILCMIRRRSVHLCKKEKMLCGQYS